VRAAGTALAAITGAIVCGGLVFWIAYVAAGSEGGRECLICTHYVRFMVGTTVAAIVGGGWIGIRVFRLFAASGDTGPTL